MEVASILFVVYLFDLLLLSFQFYSSLLLLAKFIFLFKKLKTAFPRNESVSVVISIVCYFMIVQIPNPVSDVLLSFMSWYN